MKKLSIFAALVVAMSAVSCVEDINDSKAPAQAADGVSFTATFDATPSKAVLEPGAEESKVAWEANDQVSVLVGEGNYLYTAASAGYATTLNTEAAGVPEEGTYYGLYPYDDAASLAEGVITTALPTEQTAVLCSFSTHLAVAQAVEGFMAFKNVCGLVKVTVSDAEVTKVEFKGNTNEIVAGGVSITVTNTPAWRATETGSQVVTLVPAGEAATLAKGVYYLAVLPQTFEGGITVTAYKGDEAWDVRKVETPVTVERSDIKGSNSFGVEGSGTEADPYILDAPQDLVEMRNLATYGGETWFKMVKDIDMKGITDYIPVNNVDESDADGQTFEREIHFDGGNHTISNFSCDDTDRPYPSLFGVLYGSVKDLKVVNATIISTGEVAGILGGYVGTTDKPATVTNVDVQGTVTSSVGRSGGFAGNVVGATFTDCNANVTVKGAQDVGGFVGKVQGVSSITRCNATVDVTTTFAGNARSGGFIGWNAGTNTTITDCHVLEGSVFTHDATISSAQETTCGGFIGYGDSAADNILTISGCSSDIDMTTASQGQCISCFIGQFGYASTVTVENSSAKGKVEGETNYYAGLIGRLSSSNVTLKGCSFSGTVKGASGVGGLVGAVENEGILTVSQSSVSGTIKNTGYNVGGIVGLVAANVDISGCHYDGTLNVSGYAGGIAGGIQSASNKCEIKRSYSTGSLTASSNYVGGLIGAAQGTGLNVTNCWSSMEVSATGQQSGGLVGTTTSGMTMANCYATGNVTSMTAGAAGIVGRVAASSSITNCIAWNATINCSNRSSYDKYAPGAILGCAQANGTYSGCWRRSDMKLIDNWETLENQDDYVEAMPPQPSYSTATHQQAYHGKAADADATISSVAKTLGWSSDIWDFSKEVPTLKPQTQSAE